MYVLGSKGHGWRVCVWGKCDYQGVAKGGLYDDGIVYVDCETGMAHKYTHVMK